MRLTPLEPFGLEVRVEEGTPFDSIDPAALHAWVAEHRLVVLRGVRAPDKHALPAAARRLGPLQAWPFGSVHELVPERAPKNYLYTRRPVPLHWDGAFTPRAPRYLLFHCVEAPAGGGETTFVDTTKVWAAADVPTRDRWRALRFAYQTDRVAHYGGRFEARVVAQHPYTGQTILRFAEPVDDLNPVHVEAIGTSPLESAAMITELRAALYEPSSLLAHEWRAGDVVIADNHALLHGRNAFGDDAPRLIRRVNVHGPERGAWDTLRDSLRIRRPEFLVAEIPILAVAVLLVQGWRAPELAPIALLFFLLFHFGDMINCLADRDLDAVYKTQLSEAVYGLGTGHVRAQIAITVASAVSIATWLAYTSGRWGILALALFGLLLGSQYSLRPLWLKARGPWQVLALWAVIFVGPMTLVTHALGGALAWPMLALFACYGAMQQGIVLVNTAEDLPEDRAMGVRTTAVALGLEGTVALALAMIVLGGAGAGALLLSGRLGLEVEPVELVPLALAWAWVAWDVGRLAWRMRGASDALSILRPRAKRVPLWITATAWGTLASLLISRLGS